MTLGSAEGHSRPAIERPVGSAIPAASSSRTRPSQPRGCAHILAFGVWSLWEPYTTLEPRFIAALIIVGCPAKFQNLMSSQESATRACKPNQCRGAPASAIAAREMVEARAGRGCMTNSRRPARFRGLASDRIFPQHISANYLTVAVQPQSTGDFHETHCFMLDSDRVPLRVSGRACTGASRPGFLSPRRV